MLLRNLTVLKKGEVLKNILTTLNILKIRKPMNMSTNIVKFFSNILIPKMNMMVGMTIASSYTVMVMTIKSINIMMAMMLVIMIMMVINIPNMVMPSTKQQLMIETIMSYESSP